MAHRTRSKATILLVEDTPEVQDLLVAALRRDGHTLLPAGDASEALEAVRLAHDEGRSIDLLVSDVYLPGVSGFALAREVAGVFPAIRAIFMSGYFDPDPPPGVAVLQKPFAPDTLLALIQSNLHAP